MSKPPPDKLDQEAFVAQVLSYLDGTVSPQAFSELKEVLAGRPAFRTLFVQVCNLHGALHGLLRPQTVSLPAEAAVPPAGGGAAAAAGEARPVAPEAVEPSGGLHLEEADSDTCFFVEDADSDTVH
jgi:hypothetical protein